MEVKSRKIVAFTLAEVLITLGIIGVVVALTMPSLIQNYRKHVVETKLARVYSVMNQAIKMVSAEYGEPNVWMKDCGVTMSTTCTSDEAIEWFKTYTGKYLKTLKIIPAEEKPRFLVYFPDGSILSISNALYDTLYCIDEKAYKNQKTGINSFAFRFNPLEKNKTIEKIEAKDYFEPYYHDWDGKRESLFTHSTFGCHDNAGTYCTKLIQINGWKVPEDYPFKF